MSALYHTMPHVAPTPLDPVTFEPYPEDAPPVTLTLTYDSTPERTGFERAAWGVPAWVLALGGAYFVANYFGGRI